MTRRGVQPLDPALDRAIASLPQETQERLNILRLRLLLAPDVKKWLGKDPEPLTEGEQKALQELSAALRGKENG